MFSPDPFTPAAISAGILTNIVSSIIEYHVQDLDGTLVGRILKKTGLVEPHFDDRLRDTLHKALELYFKSYPKYNLSGIDIFLSDPAIARQIGNYILDRQPLDQDQIKQAFDRYLNSDRVTEVSIQRNELILERIIPDFLECFLKVLSRQLSVPQMGLLLEILELNNSVIDAMRASDEQMRNYIAELLDTKLSPEALRAAYQLIQQKPSTYLTNEIIANLHQQYCHTLYARNKNLDFKGIMHVERNRPMGIPLEEIFVFPDVLIGMPEYETLERENIDESNSAKREGSRRVQEDERELARHQNLSKRKRIVLQREELQSALKKNSRLVILGDPGSGKSTLLLYLMLRLAQGQDAFNEAFPQLTEVPSTIPLYVPLATYAEVWRTHPSGERSLKSFLPRYLRDIYLDSYSDFLQIEIERGRVFFLLDGLDEILDSSLRIQIVRQIEAFTYSFPENRFIVTSRIVGYKEAQLAAEYEAYTLADFDEKQIRAFTKKWCPAYECWVKGTKENLFLEEAATKEADRLFQATQLNQGVRKLAVNPLLLTILAIIQRQGIELPSHRVELFDLCAATLLETWVKAKGQSTNLNKNELIKILRPLAFWMHEHPEVGAISEEELIEQITKQILNRKITNRKYDAMRLAEQFLHTVRGETGVLIERGKQRYGFLHQTFEEYFAARELVIRKDRNDFIKRHLHDARWHEVILLAVSIIGILDSDEEGVTELVYDAIMKAGSSFEEWLHRDLLFAGLCLADNVGVDNECEGKIIKKILDIYLTTPYSSVHNAISNILTSLNETKVASKLVSLVLPVLHNRAAEVDRTLLSSSIPLPKPFKKNHKNHQHSIQQYKEAQSKLLRLHTCMILYRLNIERSDLIEYILVTLTDANWHLRVAAAQALEYLDENQPRVIDALLQAIADPDSDVRWAAARALGHLGAGQPQMINALPSILSDPATGWIVARELRHLGRGQSRLIDSLLRDLDDTNSKVRWAVAYALGQLGPRQPKVINRLLQALFDPDTKVRKEVISTLVKVGQGQSQVIDALLQTLSGPDSDVKQGAISALSQLGSEQPLIINTLLEFLAQPDFDVQKIEAQMLTNMVNGQLQVINVLLLLIADPNSEVISHAVHTLGYLSQEQPQAIDALFNILANPTLNWAVAQGMGYQNQGQPRVIDALLKAFTEPSSSFNERAAAVNALKYLGSGQPQVIDALIRTLSDHNSSVRLAAINVLRHLGGEHPQVIHTLIQTLSDSDSEIEVRVATVDALGDLGRGHPQVNDVIIQALSDPSPMVRKVAVDFLGYSGGEQQQAIDALLQTLSDSKSEVREAAVYALGHMSQCQEQPQVIDALLQSLSDPYSNVRTAAEYALEHLGQIEVAITSHKKLTTETSSKKEISTPIKEGQWESWRVHALLAMLTKKYNPYEREAAVHALGLLGQNQPQLIDALFQALSDPSQNVRLAAAHALGQLGNGQLQVIDTLLQDLSNSDFKLRRATVDALVKVSSQQPNIVNYLLDFLSNAPKDKLWQEIIDKYEQRLDTKRVVRQIALLKHLGKGQHQVIDILFKLLSDPDSDVRAAAVDALRLLGQGPPEVIKNLLELLSTADSQMRKAAASVIGPLGLEQPEIFQTLLHITSKQNSNIRDTGIMLKQLDLGQSEAIDALIQVFPDSAIGSMIVQIFGQLAKRQPQLIDALLELLSNPDSDMKRVAVRALGTLGKEQQQVIDALIQTLSYHNSDVREATVRALGQLGSGQPQVIDALLKSLSSRNVDMRETTANALGKLGLGLPQVIDALLRSLSDSSSHVIRAAACALASLHIDQEVASLFIEKLLQKHKPILIDQFATYDVVDALLFALQQIIGEV